MPQEREPATSLDEQRLHALIDAGRSVVAERELDAVCDRLLRVARELTGAKYAALGVLDDSREQLAGFISVGIDPQTQRAIGDLPRGRGVLGLLISHPEPVMLEDVAGHPFSYGFPPGHPPMRSFLGVPILVRGEAWGNLYLTEKAQGAAFDPADEEAVVVLSAWAAIAIENARLHRSGEQRRRELERSLNALQATTEIARAVGGETDLERVLELIAKRSRALVGARGVAILLAKDRELEIAAIAGDLPAGALGARVPAGGSVAGRVLATGQAERVDDLSHSIRFALGAVGVEASCGLFVPLQFRGANVGVIEAFDRLEGPEFLPDDERLLHAAAASAATAVASAQSVQRDRLRRSLQVAEAERRRWARELHDETLQALAGLRLALSSGRRSGDPKLLEAAVDQALAQLSDEIASLRGLITELRPATLDDLGLAPALEALFERMRLQGISITSAIELAPSSNGGRSWLTPEMETIVYRIVQESLNNAARHAQANNVVVLVRARGEQLELSISDDGEGFDPSTDSGGFGLIGMRERVALANGEIEISSSSAGTTIDVRLPAESELADSV